MSVSKNFFKPDSAEIWQRAEIVQWMSVMGWPLQVMDSIMFDDCPTPSTVRNLVWNHGPIKALEILIEMTDSGEPYDRHR